MKTIIRNIIAVLIGILVFMFVNGGLGSISNLIIPYPVGTNLETVEGLNAAASLMEAKHYIMPFLSHALGTFFGALAVALIASNHKMKFALSIGFLGLFGGIYAVYLIIAPLWFEITDLLLSYLPMAYLAGILGLKLNSKNKVV